MNNTLTPDGAIFLVALAIAVLCVLLYVLLKVILNKDGIVVLPDWLLFGWGGAGWIPGIVLLARLHAGNAALIEHERCHHQQQERDGYIRWAWRYLTSSRARLDYEIEAYRVWLAIAPQDRARVVWWLTNSYGADKSQQEIEDMLNT